MKGIILLGLAAGAVIVWSLQRQTAAAPTTAQQIQNFNNDTNNTNSAGTGDPTGDLNNQSGTYSSGFSPGGT